MLLGRNEVGDRMAVAKLQVLWPLICAQLVYGLLKRRAESLGLDLKEVQRWWGDYSKRGVAGCVTSGVQLHWKANLAPLERVLAEEVAAWKAANDTAFVDAMAEMRASGDLGPLKRPEGANKLPYALMPVAAEGEVRCVAGLSQEESQEKAMFVARARLAVIRPLLSSVSTDLALEQYAHDMGTSGASVRNWIASYSHSRCVKALMPKRVYQTHIDFANLVKCKLGDAMDVDEPAQQIGIPQRSASDGVAPRERVQRPRDAAAEEIGRLRRVAIEQCYLRRGDAEGDHWYEAGGEKALDWYVAMKSRPETLRLWCRAYERAVRAELLTFLDPGSKEIAAAWRALFDRNLVPVRELGWSEQQIAELVRRGRRAGARGVEPVKVTASMVQAFNSHQAALDGDGDERFMARPGRRIVFV